MFNKENLIHSVKHILHVSLCLACVLATGYWAWCDYKFIHVTHMNEKTISNNEKALSVQVEKDSALIKQLQAELDARNQIQNNLVKVLTEQSKQIVNLQQEDKFFMAAYENMMSKK